MTVERSMASLDAEAARDPEAPIGEDDLRLAEMLDRYVDALHRRDTPSCTLVLKDNPQLVGLLRCLNSLELLAPPIEETAPDDSSTSAAEAPTILSDAPAGSPHRPASSPDLPREFGKYELLEEVGRGGMGVVFRARQRDLDRIVAVKMILASHLASDDEVRRFYGEARAAGGLRHPNIVGIHEVGQIDAQHYFAMDHVDGQSLAERLRQGPFDPDSAVACMTEVARAVQYLHDHGIVHRDLKPSNILLDAESTPYVTDFGLAKVFSADSAQTRTGMIVGTPSYMAPEQAAGRPSDVTSRSDVYSLGAILYELLTGRPPFQHANPLDTLIEVIEGEPTLPTSLDRRIPHELELICMRCLEKDPQRRYESAAAVADDLDRFRRGEPVAAQSSSLLQRIRRWGRREPALASRLAGLIAATTIVQVNYHFHGVDRDFHLLVMSIFGGWGVLQFLFQALLNRDEFASAARYAWAGSDAVMLTVLLWIAEAPSSPLLVGYPLLVAGSGMFFRVRLVLFTTIACLVSYAVLVASRPLEGPRHYPVIFAAVLAVIGFIVAYQVYRVRVLSRYFESRRGPGM